MHSTKRKARYVGLKLPYAQHTQDVCLHDYAHQPASRDVALYSIIRPLGHDAVPARH
jgi:hypothetical protein